MEHREPASPAEVSTTSEQERVEGLLKAIFDGHMNKNEADKRVARIYEHMDKMGASFDIPIEYHIKSFIAKVIHPLGVHTGVQTFTYDDRLDRIIDTGLKCHVCHLSL